MIGEVMKVSTKELFYSAMMLRIDRLIDVEYIYPSSEEARAVELADAMKSLRGKKLLKENANGDVSLDFALTACATLCAKPEICELKTTDKYHATIYGAEDTFMLIEHEPEDQLAVTWFADRTEMDAHVAQMMS